MHILILASLYPSNLRPTTGIFVEDQVNNLSKAGHQVGVFIAPRLYETLHFIRQTRKLPPLLEQTKHSASVYRLHSLWVPRIFPLISALIYRQAGLEAFKAYCENHGKPDVIHAHNIFYGGYMAVQIGNKYDIPMVLTEHSTNYLRGRIFLPGQHIIAKRTLKHITQPMAVGQRLADHLNLHYQPPQSVITTANVVDTDYFVPEDKDHIFTFAAVGQLTRRKRFDLLITAFAKKFRDQDVKLIIGGGGSEFENLHKLISDLNMTDQITLLGHLSRPQVRDLFQRSHVVVSSSNIETFGVTLIEAMSCGNPIIATRSGGPEQFLNSQNGILIPVDDEQALMNALQEIKSNYEEFDRDVIRTYCIAHFGEQAILSKLEYIYNNLLQQ